MAMAPLSLGARYTRATELKPAIELVEKNDTVLAARPVGCSRAVRSPTYRNPRRICQRGKDHGLLPELVTIAGLQANSTSTSVFAERAIVVAFRSSLRGLP
jgi:hypothetical protein